MVFVRRGLFPDLMRLRKDWIYRDVLTDLESIGPRLSGSRDIEKIATFARMRLRYDRPEP